MSLEALKSLFGHKAWANRELFAVLATVPREPVDPLHSCIRTLNHVYVVDRLFRAVLAGQPRPVEATNTKATPSLDQLRGDVEATDNWYLNYVAGLAPSALPEALDFTFTDGDHGHMTREEILLHVLTRAGPPQAGDAPSGGRRRRRLGGKA